MPFKSVKQMVWMRANQPELYGKWKKKYGTRVKK